MSEERPGSSLATLEGFEPMTTAAPGTRPAIPAVHVHVSRPALDAKKLDVYRVALIAQAEATALVPEDRRVLRDQLERASLSRGSGVARPAQSPQKSQRP
jgi:hypothetical protein